MISPIKLRFVWPVLLLSALFGTEALSEDLSWSPRFTGRKVVVLDPGHGGHSQGAVGPSGTTEKGVVLALAQKIKETLPEAHTVHLTRDGDYWLDIEKRAAIANNRRADVFVSLHAGGGFQHKARGMAIFCYGPNASQGFGPQQEEHLAQNGQKLGPWNNIQIAHVKESKLLANLVHRHLIGQMNPAEIGIHRAPCLVLQGADMPAILIEIGYVSHPAEEKQLRDPAAITVIADAIGDGIRAFIKQTSSCINTEGMIIEEDIGTGRGAAW